MDQLPVFDTLAAQLSSGERHELLERIMRSAPLSQEPMFPPDALPARSPEIRSLSDGGGFLARLVLFFRRLFSGKTNEELILEDRLKEIASQVEARQPGFVDRKREVLLEGFAAQLRSLRDAARFFQDILARSVEQEKGAFISVLLANELPDIHARLLAETDPWPRVESGLSLELARAAVLESWDDIQRSLTEERRRLLYADFRGLLFLRRLSGFLFDRLLGFWKPGSSGGFEASFGQVRELLTELGDLLFSLEAPPSKELLESLFSMAEREAGGQSDEAIEKAVAADVDAGIAALQAIRTFNARVPLGQILRLVSADPEHLPKDLPGGEDWFAIFRTYWKDKIEARVESCREEARSRDLAAEIVSFIGTTDFALLPHLSREGRPGSPPVRFDLALAFLLGFAKGPFPRDINRPLKILLVDGEFYRKDNLIEFTDAYNCFLHLEETILSLDLRVSPEGEVGQAWAQVSGEMVALPLKRRKLDGIRRGVEEEAEGLIRSAGTALVGMSRILQGVLKGEAGGRYDSVQNLSFLDGRSNRDYIKSLETVRGLCEKALLILEEVSGLELGTI
ncbi:MAG TPA: DUF5312 family protein [Rectinemataceae bacterium]|nr:DUF5312 family protein [Rectinemataceae bacterium]